ncbi:hypothetical protein EVAR_9967_1 [Eumeta japonica]|uniref:Uncharacterized protein n=1 Tax=Eumeta variegata TaxID=151549 RepID=A0A4C1TQX1_EUMVA|nr:hypothetical protein EVAR_9967_1 [Eumeta japonica]
MSSPTLDQKVPTHSQVRREPTYVNCGKEYTATYRGCPKAPKFMGKNRSNYKRHSNMRTVLLRDLANFPALAPINPNCPPVVGFHPAPAPTTNPWGRTKPPHPLTAIPEPPREPNRRGPPMPPPRSQ